LQLDQFLANLKRYSGISEKRDIEPITLALKHAYKSAEYYPLGDDTGVIKRSDGFDLLASEGLLQGFVERDPWFAGWHGIMVAISDIASMGGRPTAVVNTIWGHNSINTKEIYRGMAAASKVFRIPIVGGHTNLRSRLQNPPHLSVSILGKANKLLSSFAARPGYAIVAAIDLRGKYREPFLNWNSATQAPPKRLRGDIDILPKIAEQELAFAAKDINQAGLLGTCVMLSESSQAGAEIILDRIPKPDDISWEDWMRTFPGFGYLLATPPQKVPELLALFSQRDIAVAQIGRVTGNKTIKVFFKNQSGIFWDLNHETLSALLGFQSKSGEIKSELLKNRLSGQELERKSGYCQ